MKHTCTDVCDRLLERMCHDCPHYEDVCMPDEDEANHLQMLACIDSLEDRLRGVYPEVIVFPWAEQV